MISESIEKTEREAGNLHETSYFDVVFRDGSSVSEKNVNWSAFSYLADVELMGAQKKVFLSNLQISCIKVTHENLSTEIEVPEGCDVYQSIRGQASFMSTGQRIENRTVIGRIIGIVKGGEIIEERYVDVQGNQVIGFKK